MKLIHLIKFLMISLVIACNDPGPPPVDEFTGTNKDTINSKPVPVETKEVTPVYSSTPEQVNTNSAKDIVVKEDFKVAGSYTAHHYEENNKVYKTLPIVFDVSNDHIKMIKRDGPITWKNNIELNPSNWNLKVTPNRLYLVNNPVVLHLTIEYKLEGIKIKSRLFLFNAPTTSNNDSNNNISYLEKYSVEVRPGENLRNIIIKYNRENGTSFTLEEVLNMNKHIKSRKNYVVMPGDIIRFNPDHE